MHYIEETSKSVAQVVSEIQEKISEYKFGILHIHNVKETLNSKGVDFKNECQVLDICNPNFADELLSANMAFSIIMPCKISVYEEDGKTFIAMNSVVQLVDDIDPDFIETAQEIQAAFFELIDDVK